MTFHDWILQANLCTREAQKAFQKWHFQTMMQYDILADYCNKQAWKLQSI